jgi:hypothetical protein
LLELEELELEELEELGLEVLELEELVLDELEELGLEVLELEELVLDELEELGLEVLELEEPELDELEELGLEVLELGELVLLVLELGELVLLVVELGELVLLVLELGELVLLDLELGELVLLVLELGELVLLDLELGELVLLVFDLELFPLRFFLFLAMSCCSPSRVNRKGLELALIGASVVACWTAMAGMAVVVARMRATAKRRAIQCARILEFMRPSKIESRELPPEREQSIYTFTLSFLRTTRGKVEPGAAKKTASQHDVERPKQAHPDMDERVLSPISLSWRSCCWSRSS